MLVRKKPVVVQAVEWTGDNLTEIRNYCTACEYTTTRCGLNSETKLFINTLEGKLSASKGDFIIQGVEGEFYACKPDIFWKTYEQVTE
jgi:hypothetical protein